MDDERDLDDVEVEYLRAIDLAAQRGDDSAAYELSTDLTEYRKHYKT